MSRYTTPVLLIITSIYLLLTVYIRTFINTHLYVFLCTYCFNFTVVSLEVENNYI